MLIELTERQAQLIRRALDTIVCIDKCNLYKTSRADLLEQLRDNITVSEALLREVFNDD